jgi:hypothetical protein
VGVPLFQQRDSAQLSQRDRTCFLSSCAMLLEAHKPGTLPGANGDDHYLAVVQRYGDTTDAGILLQALAHYGISARLVQTADFRLIKQQIARGIPLPCGYIHRSPVDRPTCSGHWLLVCGLTPTHLVVNDPWVGAGSGQRRHPQRQWDGAALLAAEHRECCGWWSPSATAPTATRLARGGWWWWIERPEDAASHCSFSTGSRR